MSKSNEEIIPQWIINHLDKFGNCSCGRDLIKRVGKENVIKQLEKIGFNCDLRIIYENPKDRFKRKSKYPLNAYYILEVKTPIKIYFFMKNYKKGNVYLVNLNNSYPNIQNGRRPCIVVQNDYANTFSKTLIVVPITTKIKRTDLPIHVRIDSKQMALCEHIFTISKEQIICYQYTLKRSTMKDIDEAISISLSLKEEK